MTLSDTGRGGLLLLEDDHGTCELEAQRLEPLGLPIRRAYSVDEGRSALAAGPSPELMLIDYSLPGTNALEFINGLKGSGTEIPPFMVVTGRGDEAVAVAAMKAGACDYLVKNAEFLDNLLPAVRKVLERVELRRQLETARESTAKNLHLYTFLAQINLAAARTRDRVELYQRICDIAVSSGMRMAWIGTPNRDLGRINPLRWSGAVDGYLDGIRIAFGSDLPEAKGPAGTAARTLKICPCADISCDPAMAPWREKALGRGYRSCAAIPLEEGGRLAAVLNLYSAQAGFFTGDELNLLEEIRADISLALDAISAEEKHASAQAVLERTAADLAHIMDVTPVMLFRMRGNADDAPAIEWVSGNASAFTGYAPEEVLKPGWIKDHMHPEDRKGAQRLEDIPEKGVMAEDFRFRRKDGAYLWVHAQLKVSNAATGEITGSWTDITTLKESEGRFRTLFDSGSDSIFLFRLDRDVSAIRFIEVNQAACERLGYTREELLRLGPADIGRPDMAAAGRAAMERLVSEGQAVFETTHVAKDGRGIPVEVSGRRFDYEGGQYVLSVARDISERRRTEAEKFLLSEVIKASLNEIYLFDAETLRFRFLNAGALRNTGYSETEAMSLTPLDLKADMNQETFGALTGPLLRGEKQVQVFETRHRRRDGSFYPAEVHLQYVPQQGVFLAVINDISERKKAEVALKASEERLSRILANSPDMNYRYRLGPDPGFEYVSPSCLAITGYTAEEHYADPGLILKLVHPDDRPLLEKSKEGKTDGRLELRWVRKDGKFIWTEQSNVVIRGAAGEPAAIEGVVRDISARREIEAALRESEDTFRRLVEYSPDGIFIQLEGRFNYLNPEALRLFGASSPGELLGKSALERFRHDLRDKVKARMEILMLENERVPEIEEVCLRVDGSEVEALLSAVPFSRGEKKGSIVTIRDISGKKRMEAELLKSQKIESLGVLAGGIAHDFNNMLTGITANLSLLAARNPGSADLLEDALNAARSAQALTSQLLSFSKGGQPIKREISMSRALSDIFNLSTRGSASRTELRIADGLWSANVDEEQVKQAINNLLLNGMQAMPTAGILRMTAENLEIMPGAAGTPPPGRYVRITVSDTGVGIPEKYLKHMYEPYFTTKTKGHGLGLPMTWNVVRSHGGHMQLSSRQGEGTVFTVYLPATGRVLPAVEKGSRPVAKGSGRVLLLEDEDIVRKAAGRLLADLGYSCETTSDGNDTLRVYEAELASGRPFDAVILDLTIPGGMGGKEAGAELRRRHPKAVIIVSSGYSDEPVMSDYRANGFDAVLPKPYRYEELAETLHALLKKG